MNAAEIILLMLGFLSVSISFFVGKQGKDEVHEVQGADGFSRDLWTDREEEMVREQITRILKEEKEDIVVETTNILNRRSNEKIMEFDEFSSQLLAKINHNHEEVVFMYNMLSEKEKEWKEAAAKRPAAVKEPVREVIRPKPDKAEAKTEVKVPPVKTVPVVTEAPAEEMIKTAEEKPAEVASGKTQVTGLELLARHTKGTQKAAKAENGQNAAADSGQVMAGTEDKSPSGSLNDQIVKLHRQGKSVVEISRELNVGQGEVKLTIALYGGNR